MHEFRKLVPILSADLPKKIMDTHHIEVPSRTSLSVALQPDASYTQEEKKDMATKLILPIKKK